MTEKLNKILNQPLSYKKLCEALNIPTKSGKSKIYQLKDLALYCNIQISSNPKRYTIAEIYDQALIPSKAKHKICGANLSEMGEKMSIPGLSCK